MDAPLTPPLDGQPQAPARPSAELRASETARMGSADREQRPDLLYPEGSVGRLMEPPTAVFAPEQTVAEVTRRVREIVKKVFVTYCFVTDPRGALLGVVTMRDLLVSGDAKRLEEVMIRDPFYLSPSTPLMDAMKEVVHRHYPVYPVCEADGRLVGLVRGHVLFEEQAIEISAQAGRMVGVDREERLGTPWLRSLLFRQPWLQLNLLTAFVAAAVVGLFQRTLDDMVILALFLPVLAGQSGNTGCQALAVTLRGMTLGELHAGTGRALVSKEALLGMLNGALVGLTAGAGMYVVARLQAHPAALPLALIVMGAMTASCVVSGVSGALIPLGLRRIGADPATASSIFLTTATDVVSMGLLLGLATLLLL
ncbi:MAG TPA: magnesium transporter [Longimicrobiales bacterium]|nr:magnesium transporter [Longimicrobiales bacterium]